MKMLIQDLYDKGLDADEIGEFAAKIHAEGGETIDWENLTDEQVEVIMNEHNHKDDGCPICSKLAEYGKIPEDNPDRDDPDEPSLEERQDKAEQINPKDSKKEG
jgi:hypothetical protein